MDFLGINNLLSAINAFLQPILKKILELAGAEAKELESSGVRFDLGSHLELLVVLTLLFASGCWAAAIARSRGRSAALHFIFGCAIPALYPLFILLALDLPASERPQTEKKPAAAAAEPPAEPAPVSAVQAAPVAEEGSAPVLNVSYFSRIARRPDGGFGGPWLATLGGTEFEVLRILECQNEFMQVEVRTGSGAAQRMRLAYARLQKWQDKV